ncbi:MAG: argininosuccinate lyase, partial [Clostridia bacterium]|nr:argininosuccinate lyase [Clostridia bacterium]
MKMWAGRTDGITNLAADDFNSSIRFDKRMYREDIEGSIAHAKMLAKCGIISSNDGEILIAGLESILKDIESGALEILDSAEDIHMFVEEVLTKRVGDVGKKLHTARSRNDQVALDSRLYLRNQIDDIYSKTATLTEVICKKAKEYSATIMPGYTHLQRAQPITFGHHLMAYAMMLLRDMGRLQDCKKRLNVSPIGS